MAIETVYSDFRTDLAPHPITGDIALVVNEDAIIQEIKNLVLTETTERWSQGFGGNQKAYLFELPMPTTEAALRSDLELCLKNNITRATFHEIRVSYLPDQNAYAAYIEFSCLNMQGKLTLSLLLKRVR